jgi:hypothetical protein
MELTQFPSVIWAVFVPQICPFYPSIFHLLYLTAPYPQHLITDIKCLLGNSTQLLKIHIPDPATKKGHLIKRIYKAMLQAFKVSGVGDIVQ